MFVESGVWMLVLRGKSHSMPLNSVSNFQSHEVEKVHFGSLFLICVSHIRRKENRLLVSIWLLVLEEIG